MKVYWDGDREDSFIYFEDIELGTWFYIPKEGSAWQPEERGKIYHSSASCGAGGPSVEKKGRCSRCKMILLPSIRLLLIQKSLER